MAARLNRRHQDLVRDKIKVGNIIDRLEKHISGEIELSPTQVSSAKILLDKTISNAQTDLNVQGNVTVNWPEPKNGLDE
jgi:hypothetical protein